MYRRKNGTDELRNNGQYKILALPFMKILLIPPKNTAKNPGQHKIPLNFVQNVRRILLKVKVDFGLFRPLKIWKSVLKSQKYDSHVPVHDFTPPYRG